MAFSALYIASPSLMLYVRTSHLYITSLILCSFPFVPDFLCGYNDYVLTHHTIPYHIEHKMFQKYDFVGLVERFDESLVAMQLLLGLESSDILYFAANRKEQWQRVKIGRNQFTCRKPFNWELDILPEPSIHEYLAENKEWYAQNYGDYLLYQAASQSLDRTILQIGLDVFASELKKFRSLLQRAHKECIPKFPCSLEGQDQFNESRYDCMDGGNVACGYRCLNSL